MDRSPSRDWDEKEAQRDETDRHYNDDERRRKRKSSEKKSENDEEKKQHLEARPPRERNTRRRSSGAPRPFVGGGRSAMIGSGGRRVGHAEWENGIINRDRKRGSSIDRGSAWSRRISSGAGSCEYGNNNCSAVADGKNNGTDTNAREDIPVASSTRTSSSKSHGRGATEDKMTSASIRNNGLGSSRGDIIISCSAIADEKTKGGYSSPAAAVKSRADRNEVKGDRVVAKERSVRRAVAESFVGDILSDWSTSSPSLS